MREALTATPGKGMHPIILWLSFLLISFGLGYASLVRYDPRTAPGLEDTREYFRMVETGRPADDRLDRALIPMLARPVYLLIRGRTRSWNEIAVSLLAVNAAVCALTALFVLRIGGLLFSPVCGLVAALLYLLNFDIANYLLAGMVESVQTLTIAALAWFLLRRRWAWAAAAAAVGAMGKDVSLPISLAFLGGWVLTPPIERRQLVGAAAVGLAALFGFLLMPLLYAGKIVNVLTFALDYRLYGGVRHGFLGSVVHCLIQWNLWLTLCWILPGALLIRRRLPRRWWFASAAAGAAVLGLSAWGAAGSNIARPAFNALGPILCVGTAAYVTEKIGSARFG